MFAKFGPAGNCEDFYEAGNKSALEMPVWLKENNLDCYEYQCGRGVKISDDAAKKLGKIAKENNILLSIHAPYYISLSSIDEEKRLNSIKYILDTLHAAKIMGADRIVVHSGSCGSITRKEALNLAFDTLKLAIAAADERGYGDIHICPETMGKVKQLGTVEEVIKLCQLDERLIPTIDFGHVNSMTLGGLKNKEDFYYIFDDIKNKLGEERGRSFHAHYSRIEYTNAGEKKHHTFSETEFEPDFLPIGEIMAEYKIAPRIICESAGTQTRDARAIKDIYLASMQEKRK
ncbi:MAG: endonuclease IV [Ruminococcaceae bacterium]|nr:endonuclease IV [Oscillospiraceae bacterium]